MRKLLLLSALMASVASSFAQNSQSNYSTLSNGLVAYYPLNNNIFDYVNSYNLFGSNSVYTNDRFGAPNGALNFNGNSYFQSATNPYLPYGNQDRSLSLWVKCDSSLIGNNGDVEIIDYGNTINNQANQHFGLFIQGGVYGIHFMGADQDIMSTCVPDTNWHLFTCIYTNQVAQLYRDGVLLNQSPKSTFTTEGLLTVGAGYTGANGFKGDISDIRIYNRALSPNEVTALYTLESTLPTQEQDEDVAYFAATIPTNQVFCSALAANTAFASDLASTITSNPSIYGLFVGPQGPKGPVGPQGPQGFQGQAGVGSPQNLLTNTAFLQALATNQVFLNALASNVLIASKSLQTITFAPIPAQTYKPFKTLNLNAAASSKLPITYSCANPAVGTIIGNVLQLQGSGSTTVTATQVGNQYNNPATASQPLVVH